MFEKSINRSGKANVNTLIKPLIIGIFAAIIICVLFSFLVSAVIAIFKVFSEFAVVPIAIVALAVGVFFGAWICGKIIRKRGLICGIIIGLAVFLLLLIVGLLGADSLLGSVTWIKFAVILIAGAAGGYFSMCRPRKHRC